MGEIEYRILGAVEVRRNRELLDIEAPRQRAVLAALLLEANHVVSVARLTTQLWGDSPPAMARNTIQSLVLRLRRILTPCRSVRDNDVLLTRHPGYVLRVGPGQLDLHRFHERVAVGRAALSAGQPELASRAFGEALELWQGEPLADAAGVGLQEAEVPALRESRLYALEQRIDADLMLGRHDALIPELLGLVAKQPLRERLHGQLMLALYRSDQQAEALKVFCALRHRLVTDLAVEPAQDLRRLHHRILTQDATLLRDPQPGPLGASRMNGKDEK